MIKSSKSGRYSIPSTPAGASTRPTSTTREHHAPKATTPDRPSSYQPTKSLSNHEPHELSALGLHSKRKAGIEHIHDFDRAFGTPARP